MVTARTQGARTRVASAYAVLGRAMTFHVPTKSYSPTTRATTTTEVDYAVTALMSGETTAMGLDAKLTTEAQVALAAKDVAFVPVARMRVTIAGESWTAVEVKPTQLEGITVSWRLKLRKGA